MTNDSRYRAHSKETGICLGLPLDSVEADIKTELEKAAEPTIDMLLVRSATSAFPIGSPARQPKPTSKSDRHIKDGKKETPTTPERVKKKYRYDTVRGYQVISATMNSNESVGPLAGRAMENEARRRRREMLRQYPALLKYESARDAALLPPQAPKADIISFNKRFYNEYCTEYALTEETVDSLSEAFERNYNLHVAMNEHQVTKEAIIKAKALGL